MKRMCRVNIHPDPRPVALAILILAGTGLVAADPRPEAIAGWSGYVRAVEEGRSGHASRLNAADRRAVLAGRSVVRRLDAPPGVEGNLPSALVHRWQGAVLVPGITLEALIARLREQPPPQRDVLKAAVLSRGADSMRVYLRLRRTRIVTVVYDTEHQVTFRRLDAGQAESASISTSIVQVDHAGTPEERRRAAGEDDGYLWRLNAYWRYEQVPEGVIAVCESLTLSRSVPFGLRTVAGPIINSTARESMTDALAAVRGLGGR
jgi:hypothetical protein